MFTLLAAASSSSIDIDIKYEFSYTTWENLGRVYTCSVVNLSVESDDKTITSATGNHLNELHNNNDVLKLNIQRQRCEYLPKGLEKLFPNLEGLRIASSGLKILRQSDVSVFLNLRNCDVFNNRLTTLDADLFARNPNLEYLYFGSNIIEQVGRNILSPLKNLKKANFDDNTCIRFVAETSNDLPQLQRLLEKNCPMNDSVTVTDASEIIQTPDPTQATQTTSTKFTKEKTSNWFLWIVALSTLIVTVGVIFYFFKYNRNYKLTQTDILNKFNIHIRRQQPAANYEDESAHLADELVL